MAGKQAIHLVGSMPLDSAEDVFRTVCGATGGNVRRVPDGETGMRINWIRCIQDMLTAHPDFEVDPETPPLQWRQWDGTAIAVKRGSHPDAARAGGCGRFAGALPFYCYEPVSDRSPSVSVSSQSIENGLCQIEACKN